MTDEISETCKPQVLDTVLQGVGPCDLEQFAACRPDTARVVQLSEGRFAGRLSTHEFPGISLCLEWCNQMIEKEIHLDNGNLAFSMCVDTRCPDLSYNGVTKEKDWILLQSGGDRSVLISPAESTQLTVKVSKRIFRELMDALPEIADWLNGSHAHGEILKTKFFANRLRDVCRVALEASQLPGSVERRQAFGNSLLASLVTGLTFEWLSRQAFSTYQRPRVLELFQAARQVLLKHDGEAELLSSCGLGSRRSIEKAFAELINMGPAKYSRIVRLNNSRRKLHDRTYADTSIGDIAAEEGFWDWSRFTSYYRKQFGELPSETRSKSSFPVVAPDMLAA
nr:helix-turn-helix domain-containing protein [uncultured Roseibium sp.]